MPCYFPETVYRKHGGGITQSRLDASCLTPLTAVCGRCVGCCLSRASQWAARVQQESTLHARNSMVTLTFDQEHLPSDGSVRKRDLQLFWKRLRKAGYRFKYLACGEYGEKTYRPHYHACVLGENWEQDRHQVESPGEYPLFESPTLTKLWGQGIATISELTFESAAYVARYVLKKAGGKDNPEQYRRLDVDTGEEWYVEPEFQVMSRGGRNGRGIGYEWFQRYYSDVYPSDECVVQGRKLAPPRYYDSLLGERDNSAMARMRRQRAKRKAEAPKQVLDGRSRQRAAQKRVQARGNG